MSIVRDKLSVRDFSHTDFAGNSEHLAHASGLPLLAGENDCWPVGVDVFEDRYAKRLSTTSPSVEPGTLWIPLFNRAQLSAGEPLIPSFYLAEATVKAHGLTERPRWCVIDLNGLVSAVNDPFLRELRVPESGRNPYLKWTDDGVTFFIDTVSLLELVVAQDEPLFRLLLSPFRGEAVRARATADEVVILWANDTALTSRGGTIRSVGPPNWDSFETACCIAYWLAAPERRSELSRCAESLRRGAEPHLPRLENLIMASVRGYERETSVLVRSIRPLESTPLWPCERKVMTILNRRGNRGRVLTVPPLERRPEGTVRQGRASVQKMVSTEVSALIRLFKGSPA